MKFFKYVLLFLAIFMAGFAIGFGLSKIKNNENALVSLPTSLVTTQKTSAFSLENAPTESLRGKITAITGEIGWQGRTATEAAKLSSPITIQQGEKLSTGKKSSLSLLFSDACSLAFSENTEVEIIQTLPANIVFSQTSGRANYIKTGSYPVSIRAMSLLVEEDGDITVSINPNLPLVTLTLTSGKATAAYNDLYYVSHEVRLTTGQTFTFNYDMQEGVLV